MKRKTYFRERKKSLMRETPNLSLCADSSTDAKTIRIFLKTNVFIEKNIYVCVSRVTCHLSPALHNIIGHP